MTAALHFAKYSSWIAYLLAETGTILPVEAVATEDVLDSAAQEGLDSATQEGLGVGVGVIEIRSLMLCGVRDRIAAVSSASRSP